MKKRKYLGIAAFAAWLAAGCGPPQIGMDREAFKAVDALYTAVSLRDPALVDRCDKSLDALHDAGKLPDSAHVALESMIRDAKAGGWDGAISRLNDFMLGQRR